MRKKICLVVVMLLLIILFTACQRANNGVTETTKNDTSTTMEAETMRDFYSYKDSSPAVKHNYALLRTAFRAVDESANFYDSYLLFSANQMEKYGIKEIVDVRLEKMETRHYRIFLTDKDGDEYIVSMDQEGGIGSIQRADGELLYFPIQ